MAVRIDGVVVDACYLVVFEVFKSDVEWGVLRSDATSDMNLLADVTDDIVGRVGLEQCLAGVMQAGLVNAPAVPVKPVIFRYDCDVIMTVALHVEAVQTIS